MGQSVSGLRATKNTASDDDEADDVKRQVEGGNQDLKPIYQLTNVNTGGGRLIELIKSRARSTGSFGVSKSSEVGGATREGSQESEVDQQIRELVRPLLYDGGNGKLIPLREIWRCRFGAGAQPEASGAPEEAAEPASDGCSRWVCWRLDERGFVGETALHICFLLSTQVHMILAQKLLAMFPMLINDIYTCDRYFGESCLHMAIVNEDVKIVKLLLDHGAHVHERCLGSFFVPLDQKDRANVAVKRLFERLSRSSRQTVRESLSRRAAEREMAVVDFQSNAFGNLETNYDGYAYWGEYPLSFAAGLGLVDCYKLLLAKGADPNRQDSNGNSTLHMTVIANRKDMFDLCFSSGADLSVANKQRLSPLTLAAKLRRVDMFFHILALYRQVNWLFCNVGFLETPLAEIDSVDSADGSCKEESVLSIVVFGSSNEHLQMFDGLLSQLLRTKWDTAAKWKFRNWLFLYLLFLSVSLVAYFTRFHGRPDQKPAATLERQIIGQTRFFSECLLVLFVVYYLWLFTHRTLSSLKANSFLRSLLQSPELAIFICTCLLILSCIPLRLLGWADSEDLVASFAMLLCPLKLLFFCRVSPSIGPFIVMIYKIVVNDVLCFVVFLIIFVAGFSQSFLIMFKTHRSQSGEQSVDRNYFSNFLDGIISMHMMALNEFSIVYDEFHATEYPYLAKLMFCVYMVLVSILLINMLIAMLGKTYQDIVSQPNESLRQWARAILVVERLWTRQDRLQMVQRYSHTNPTGASGIKYYGSTWALKASDFEKLRNLQTLISENHANAKRLSKLSQTERQTTIQSRGD